MFTAKIALLYSSNPDLINKEERIEKSKHKIERVIRKQVKKNKVHCYVGDFGHDEVDELVSWLNYYGYVAKSYYTLSGFEIEIDWSFAKEESDKQK